MTRQEFIDSVNSFYDLIDFCQNEDIDITDDVYDSCYLNDIIIDCIKEMNDWEDVLSLVRSIPRGCEFYREDGYGGYEDAYPYFEDYKRDVIRYMDNMDSWDEEDEEIEEVEDEDLPHEYKAWRSECVEQEEDIEISSFMAVLGRAS